MVNKGRIYREIGKILDILQIWSNQMMNWGEKLRVLVDLERRLQDKVME